MRIQGCSNTNFQSKAHPIEPYVVNTVRGMLSVSEATMKDFKRRTFVRSLSRFFCNNFSSMTSDPGWLGYCKKAFNREDSFIFTNFYECLRARLLKKDDSKTVLVAKDMYNRIQGACVAYKCDIVPNAEEVCYIDSLAVNKLFRESGVGKGMIEKILLSEKNRFTDVFLAGDKMVSGFYKKLGFKTLSEQDESQKTIMDYIEKQRADYPDYVELFTKPIQEDKPRWFKKSAETIKKL